MTERAWAHLDVVAEVLATHGNPRRTTFQPSQGGWWCSMVGRLHPHLARGFVTADPRLDYDETGDVLSCRHCWASIFGGEHTIGT